MKKKTSITLIAMIGALAFFSGCNPHGDMPNETKVTLIATSARVATSGAVGYTVQKKPESVPYFETAKVAIDYAIDQDAGAQDLRLSVSQNIGKLVVDGSDEATAQLVVFTLNGAFDILEAYLQTNMSANIPVDYVPVARAISEGIELGLTFAPSSINPSLVSAGSVNPIYGNVEPYKLE